MKIFSFTCLLILLSIVPDTFTDATGVRKKRSLLDTTLKILKFLPFEVSLLKDAIELWNLSLKKPDVPIQNLVLQNNRRELLEHIERISSGVSELEKKIQTDAVVSVLQAIPKLLNLESQRHEFTSIINQINFAHEKLQEYFINYNDSLREEANVNSPDSNQSMISGLNSRVEFEPLSKQKEENNENNVYEMSRGFIKRAALKAHSKRFIEMYTLEDFAAWAAGHSSNSLMSLLRKLHDLIVTDDNSGFFHLMKENLEETPGSFCNLGGSPHQTIYNLYVKVALTQLKGNILLQFSYMLLKMHNKGDFVTEAQLALQSYERYSKSELELVRNILSDTDRSFYKCDPKQHVDGVTYTKLTKLLQGYIENEVNLNPYGTCRENCIYYTLAEYNGCFKEQFCSKQPPCKGKVINCNYVDSDMTICTSSDPERRYDWVQYKRGKSLGNTGSCQNRNLFKVDSWWRYLFWHCSYCLCLCDGGDDVHQQSDRYINLREVTSDIEENKVVTGVRIVKNNRIIHIQIQQGVLGPRATVNKTSLSWKPVDNYSVNNFNVKNEVDYHTMSWIERAVDLDDVFGPPEHVLTGIRFRKIGAHINLEIRVTPLNFTTGEMFKLHSFWTGNDNTDISHHTPRTEIILEEPDIPLRKGPHTLMSKHNQYIQFQSSSFKTDVGQTTVPFLDSQALVSNGAPISGIGLIHRGKQGSGGFLAPKLISYDFSPHLRFDKNE